MPKLTASETIRNRCSIRDFKPDPISLETVQQILDLARYAPSGGNLQPWKVVAIAGDETKAVVDLAIKALTERVSDTLGYPVYPDNLSEPYRTRRRRIAEQLYEALDISFGDENARNAQLFRNFSFFGAPNAFFFIIDKNMGRSQWAHLGMFIQSVALAATEQGLGTCIQEAWAPLRAPLARHFQLNDNEIIYCGMALGHPRETSAVNIIKTDRVAVNSFSTFLGF